MTYYFVLKGKIAVFAVLMYLRNSKIFATVPKIIGIPKFKFQVSFNWKHELTAKVVYLYVNSYSIYLICCGKLSSLPAEGSAW